METRPESKTPQLPLLPKEVAQLLANSVVLTGISGIYSDKEVKAVLSEKRDVVGYLIMLSNPEHDKVTHERVSDGDPHWYFTVSLDDALIFAKNTKA